MNVPWVHDGVLFLSRDKNYTFKEFAVHVVAIYGWKAETEELAQLISETLGNTVFDAQQRLAAGSPSVLVKYGSYKDARELEKRLNQNGIPTLVVDAEEVQQRTGQLIVEHFEFRESSLYIETINRRKGEISFRDIDLLLPVTGTTVHSETKTYTERKFSIGKTLLTGGIPMSKKVEHQQNVETVKRSKTLFVYIKRLREPAVFRQNKLNFEDLGEAMKISREQNFFYLMSELHRLSPGVVYDDRLQRRIGQVRLLGPTLNPETNLDLAVEILARSLRAARKGGKAFG